MFATPLLTQESLSPQLSTTRNSQISEQGGIRVIGKIKIHRSLIGQQQYGPTVGIRGVGANGNGASGNSTTLNRLSVLDFIELHAYSSLLMIFAFIITMAVVSMAFGNTPKTPPKDSSSPSFFIEYLISIILVPIAETLLELMLKNKLFSPHHASTQPLLHTRTFLIRRVHTSRNAQAVWRTDIHTFQMITLKRHECTLFGLYLTVFAHGLAGVVYVYMIPSSQQAVSNFQTQNMELFCLMCIYMFSSIIAPPLKLLRYFYLFRYLPSHYSKLQRLQSSPPHSIEYELDVHTGNTDAELSCVMCMQEIKQCQGFVELPCRCGTAYHAGCVERWFNGQGHLNCPGCMKMIMGRQRGNNYLPRIEE
ncbi:hypothetical protein FGO68_gene7690 [Halteria grandinella]|uniref:RING-type domain-containing protein n=1 Tax=Halteria grandinella TaxID=5974 RepID=A0A8J8NMR0_HALGN|nr:hypothetical protein FGO68_gene7690 [Halteria grandinella]